MFARRLMENYQILRFTALSLGCFIGFGFCVSCPYGFFEFSVSLDMTSQDTLL